MRSWLTVPAVDEATLRHGFFSGADALVIDLASVLPPMKKTARRVAAEFLAKYVSTDSNHTARYVLIHPLSSDESHRDLEALMPAVPDGILLPRATGSADVQKLDVMISAQEALCGLPLGRTDVVAIAGDTAAGALSAASFAGKSSRLSGLAWQMTHLAQDLGASRFHDRQGSLADTLRLGRSLTLMGAAAAGVDVIDAPSGLFYTDRLARDCREARADGFTGKFALHASQVPVINVLFSPTRAEIDIAQAIVAAFDGGTGAGSFAPDGSLLTAHDHLRAIRTLARARLSD